jgi:hypothetical protein
MSNGMPKSAGGSLFPKSSVLGLAPEGWPVVDDGLVMAFVDRILVVRFDERLTPRAFEHYREEWLRSVDARGPHTRVVAFYDIPSFAGFTARQRKEMAEMLKSREATLRATTVAMALATPSPIVRGVLHAVYWLAPPPFDYAVVSRCDAAFAFLAEKMPTLDPLRCEQAYAELRRRV